MVSRNKGKITFLRSLFLFLFFFLPGSVSAEGISGYLDLTYSDLDSKTKLPTGDISKIRSRTFRQQYSLTLEKTIYPNLRFLASGIFEKDIVKSTIDGAESSATTTIARPLLDLTLKTPFTTAGVSYIRREEKDDISGSPTVTTVNEEYSAILGLKPSGLPSLDMQIKRTNIFDKSRSLLDTTEDSVLLTSAYEPMKNLIVRYQGNYKDSKNRLVDLDIKELDHNGKITYDGTFFKDRVTLSASYDVTRRSTDITSGGGGNVLFQVIPVFGLSSLNDIPIQGALDQNNALIDGTTLVGAGINIGPPSVGGDTRARNIGLDFFLGTELNTLFVWVDRELPGSVASSFSWDIYISSDNLTWTFFQTVSPAPFGPFQNRFELTFPNVKTRFIKVVTKPLSLTVVAPPGFDVSNIFVTELQAFLSKPAAEAKGETVTTTQIYNVYVKARLLDSPFIFYDLSYFLVDTSGAASARRSTLSNGLNISHRLSEVFSGTARIAREDSVEQTGNIVAYIANASLRAIPLKTLSHNLSYSGRFEDTSEGRTERNALFLYNTAELYRGISAYLSGGISFSRLELDRREKSIVVSFGANIVPHRTLTLTLNASSTNTDQTGGGRPDSSLVTRRGDVSLAYYPYKTLYLFASWSKLIQDTRKDTLQNYAVTWAPFPGGALQFTFAYNENLRAFDNAHERIIRPSLRLNFSARSFLDISYLIIRSDSVTEKTSSRTFNTNLRIAF